MRPCWNDDEFTTYLLSEGLADSTIDDYRSYYRRWTVFARTKGYDPLHPYPLQVREWSHTLPTGVSTRDGAKSTIRWVCIWRGVPDVSSAVARPEVNTRNRRMPLVRREAAILMATAHGLGDQGTCCIIGLCTGMRVSEMTRFRWGNIEWDDGTVTYKRRKGKDWLTVPLHPVLAARLEPLKPLDGADGFVLAADNQGHLSEQCLRNWIAEVSAAAGLHRVLPHDLRRTYGRAVYEAADRDITVPQRALGHADPAVTARYIRADLDAVIAAVRGMDYYDLPDDGMPEAA